MTLDEYIYESGIFRNSVPPPYKSPHDTEDRFEDVTDMIVIKQEEDVEMLEAFDLRDKLSSNNTEQPNIRSQQWRLLPPNKSQNRPSGMPPLVPKDKESIQLNFLKQVKNNNHKWGNRRNRNNRNKRQQQQNYRNNGQSEDDSQSTSMNKRNLNQQTLKKFGGKNNTIGVGRRNGFQQWNQQNRQKNPTLGSVMNMTIESTVCNDSLANSSLQSNNSSVTSEPLQNGMVSSSLGILQPSSVLDASGGIKLELMPFIAGKLLEALQGTNTVNTPKYDFKVQKEIHTLQNKTMIYKCPGGNVISSDGPGLPCKMTPASTGISLNQRFA